MKKTILSIFFTLILLASLSLVMAAPAAASGNTYYVAVGGNDTTGTGSSGSPWATIGHAITSATAGDTIMVAAGTYSEVVTVNKSLTLKGAQAGTDARGRSGPESIIPAQGSPSAISIAADNVTINGFSIEGAGTAGGQKFGINAAAGTPTSGVHITNNIFRNLFEGLNVQGPNTNVSSHMTVDYNAFFDDLSDTFAKDAGIWMASAPSNNLTIMNNSFSGHDKGDGGDYAAINIDYSTNLTITNNTSHNDGTFLVLVGCTTVMVDGNSVSNSGTGFTQSSVIFLDMGNNGVTIQNNSLDGGYRGVRFANIFNPTGAPNQNIQILNNTITNMVNRGIYVPLGTASVATFSVQGNNITGNPIAVENGTSGALNATNNWWGTTVQSEIAALVIGNVTYSPYLHAAPSRGNTTVRGTMQAESISVTAPSAIDFGAFVSGMNGPKLSTIAGSVTAFANTWEVDVTASSAALKNGATPLVEPLQISPGDTWYPCVTGPTTIFSYMGNPTTLPFKAEQMITGPDIALGPGTYTISITFTGTLTN